MNLPADIFEHMLASIAVLGEAKPRQDERRAPRTKLSTQLQMTPWEDPEAAHSVRVHDLSMGGIGIFHSTRLRLDEQFVVRLPGGEAGSSLWMCDVIYWEPLAEDMFAIGAKFNRPISEAELSQHKADADRRHNGVLARITKAIHWPMRKAS